MRVRHLNLPKLREAECQRFSNMRTPTSLNTLNLLDVKGMTANAMLSKLEETFPPTNPTPEDTMEKIMYRSGQRSVVEWVIQYMEEN